MHRLFSTTLAIATLMGGLLAAAPLAAVAEGEESATRIFVADASSNTVRVLEKSTGKVIAGFSMPGAINAVNASSSGRYVFALHTNDNRLSVIDTGLKLVEHGEHQDIEVSAPYVRGTVNTGRKPIDFWARNGLASVHNDDDGTLAVFSDERLEYALDYVEIKGVPGHNNGAVLGNTVLMSVAAEGKVTAYSMATGLPIQTWDGCMRTHGWATIGSMMAISGCADGVLVYRNDGIAVSGSKLTSPAMADPADMRISAVSAHPGSPIIYGNLGSGLAKIRPDLGTIEAMPLPARQFRFAYDADGERVVVLTVGGSVHLIDAASGDVEKSLNAVEPVSSDASAPRPALAVGDGVAYVTNPGRREVVEINLSRGEISRRLEFAGTPTGIAVVTVSGVAH